MLSLQVIFAHLEDQISSD